MRLKVLGGVFRSRIISWEKSLIIGKISTGTGAEFDIETHRSLSWVIRLTKIVSATKQRPWEYSEVVFLGKPKHIFEDKLIKYNLSLGKPKRIRWGFPKVVTILNTLQSITI